MAQDWETPTPPTGWYVEPPGGAPVTAGYPAPAGNAAQTMRPLSLGELLDRTFTVYRSRFWLFAGIGAVSSVLQVLIQAAQLIPMHLAGRTGNTGDLSGPVGISPRVGMLSPTWLAGIGIRIALVIFVVMLLYLLVFVVTQAATVFALSEVYLGRETTIGSSIRATIGKWYRYLGIGLWQAFSLFWIPAVVIVAGVILLALNNDGLKILGGVLLFLGVCGGFPVGVILWLRNSLGVQATVIETLTVRASMRRSKVLAAGAKWKLFVLMLLVVALNYAAGLLQVPLLVFVMYTMSRGGRAIGSEVAMILVSFVAHAAVQPVAMIGLSLIYFDQRVRKEAFDLYLLMGPEVPVVVPAAPETPFEGMVAAPLPVAVPSEVVAPVRADDEPLV